MQLFKILFVQNNGLAHSGWVKGFGIITILIPNLSNCIQGNFQAIVYFLRNLNSLKTRHLHCKSHLAINIELFPPSPRKYRPIMFQCTKWLYCCGKRLEHRHSSRFPTQSIYINVTEKAPRLFVDIRMAPIIFFCWA